MEKLQKFNLFIILSFIILFSSLSGAVPPPTTVDYFPTGYALIEAQLSTIKVNQSYNYNFILYNSSNGVLINNDTVNCRIFVVNNTGILRFKGNISYTDDEYWSIMIPAEVFSSPGEYPYGVDCIDGSGGALSGTFYATPTGEILDPQNAALYITLIVSMFITLVILLFKFASSESLTTKYIFISISYIFSNVLLLILYKVSEYFLFLVPFLESFFHVLYLVSNAGYFIFFPVLFGIIILNNLRQTKIDELIRAGNSDEDIRMSLNRGRR
ncbi:MAG: hypothetical protein EOL97_07180 [Spirochaetia bacterium]|nr:hypothetical protein [Spirochaetia bacterium]